jgi:hypothetical protein
MKSLNLAEILALYDLILGLALFLDYGQRYGRKYGRKYGQN